MSFSPASLSTFMPLPLPMMIPFMAAQSAAMMKSAGEMWQYGKRLQSSLSNEEFNKQTFESIFLKQQNEIANMIPTLQSAMDSYSTGMTEFILKQFMIMFKEFIDLTGNVITGGLFGQKEPDANQDALDSGEKFQPPTTTDDPFNIEHTQIIGHEKHPEHPTTETIRTYDVKFTYTFEGTNYNYQLLDQTEEAIKATILNLDQFIQNNSGANLSPRFIFKLSAFRIWFKNTFGYWA